MKKNQFRALVVVFCAAVLLYGVTAFAAQPADCNAAKAAAEAAQTAALDAWLDAINSQLSSDNAYNLALLARPGCTDQAKLLEGDDYDSFGDTEHNSAIADFDDGDRTYDLGIPRMDLAEDFYDQELYDQAQNNYEQARIEFDFATTYYGQAADHWLYDVSNAGGWYYQAEQSYLEGTPP